MAWRSITRTEKPTRSYRRRPSGPPRIRPNHSIRRSPSHDHIQVLNRMRRRTFSVDRAGEADRPPVVVNDELHDDRGALTIVDVAQPTSVDVKRAGLERVLPAVGPCGNQLVSPCLSFCRNALTISGSGVPIGNT